MAQAFYLVMPVVLGIYLYGIKYISLNHTASLQDIYKDINLDRWSFDDKVQFLLQNAVFLSIIYVVLTTIAMLTRVLGGFSNPVEGKDPVFLQAVNRVMLNSNEQLFVFFPTFAYLTLYKSDTIPKHLLLTIGAAFVVARIFFSIGFVVGTIIGIPPLRAPGFALNQACNMSVFLLIFGIDLFKQLP